MIKIEWNQIQNTCLDPARGLSAFDYDAAGNRLTYTNRAWVVRTYAYDNRNREIRSHWSHGSQTFELLRHDPKVSSSTVSGGRTACARGRTLCDPPTIHKRARRAMPSFFISSPDAGHARRKQEAVVKSNFQKAHQRISDACGGSKSVRR
ncbi:MAG: hypothetical protein ACREIA_01250 [Opitutaceae bacterium]